jgi:peptidoglycan/LPS O-acetylase OafA/YrhL
MEINLGIQVVRALATLVVAATHFSLDFNKIVGPSSVLPEFMSYGYVAFDFFFVISGFVLVYASESLFGTRSGPRIFYLRRLIRIIPMYWLATALYVLVAFAVPSLGKTYSLQSIVGSFLFIPVPRLDGVMQPVVGQGWTLNYEMYFYILFAVSVAAARRMAVLIASILIVISVGIGQIFPLATAFEYWFKPFLIEFIFGMTLGLLFREGYRVPPWVGWLLVVAGLAILAFGPSQRGDSMLRGIHIGGTVAVVVAGFTLGDLFRPGPAMRFVTLLGDATYSLYLFHSFPNRAVLHGARWLGMDLNAAPLLLLAIALVLSTLLAIVMYIYIEAPTTRGLRRWFRCESTRAAASAPVAAQPAP